MSDSKSEFLSIKGKTWVRDSHGLFDYESSTVKENILLIRSPIKIIRKKHEMKEKKETEILEVDEQLVCDVLYQNSKLYIGN